METRANFVAVGAFVLVLIAGALGFAWWLADPTESQRSDEVIVIFPTDVSGLVIGAPVYFNGIKVGEVKSMDLDVDDPGKVFARVSVDRKAPLREDTKVQLGFQGLTGVAYVQFSGGSIDSPRLIEPDEDPPFMYAESSAFEDILAGARELMGSVNRIANDAADLLSENKENITGIVTNVRQFSDALGENSDQVSEALSAVSDVAVSFRAVAQRVGALSERAEEILAAVDPARVGQTIDGAAEIATGFAAVVDDVPLLMADLRAASTDLALFASGINDTLKDVDGVIAGADPEVIRRTVANIEEISGAFARRADELESTIVNARTLTANITEITTPLAERSETLGAVVDDTKAITGNLADASGQVGSLLESAQGVVDAVDADAVRSTVTNIEVLATTLAERSEALGAMIANAETLTESLNVITAPLAERSETLGAVVDDTKAITGNLADASAEVRPLIDEARGLVSAVDQDAVAQIVADIAALSDTLSGRRADIDEALQSARAASENLAVLTARLEANGDRIDTIFKDAETVSGNLAAASEKVEPVLDQTSALLTALDTEGINRTIQNVRRLSDALAERAETIGETFDDARMIAADVRAVTETVSNRASEIDQIIVDAAEVASSLNALAARASSLMDTLSGVLTDEGTGGLIQEATGAAAAIRQTAEAFGRRADEISNGVANFSTRGLQNAEALIADGRRTVQSLDRLLSRVERNPRDFLFGPDANPRNFNSRRY